MRTTKVTSKLKPRILLVEDEPLIQKIHLMMLEAIDCDVTLAENGQKAIEYATKNKYSVIFMDIGLPDTSGIAVAKTIRQDLKVRSNKSFIVALTAFIKDELRDDCIAAEIDVIENKPINTERLKQIIVRELGEAYAARY